MKMRAGGRCLEKKILTLRLFIESRPPLRSTIFKDQWPMVNDPIGTESGVKHNMALKNCQGGAKRATEPPGAQENAAVCRGWAKRV
jgi:hypothetical protein